jgi:Ca2+-binding EF-hand superfamily protein
MLLRRDIDQDGDGHVSLKEFLLATRLRMKARALEGHSDDPAVMALENAWSELLFCTMENPTWKENVPQMFDTYDLDHSGEDIDFDEFSTGIRVIGINLILKTSKSY